MPLVEVVQDKRGAEGAAEDKAAGSAYSCSNQQE